MALIDSKGYHEELDRLASEGSSIQKMDLSGASDVELQDELRRRKEAKHKDLIMKWELNISSVHSILVSFFANDFLRLAGEHAGKCSDTNRNFFLGHDLMCMRCVLLEQQAGFDGIPEGYFIELKLVDRSVGILK